MSDTGDQECSSGRKRKIGSFCILKFSLNVFLPCFLSSAAASDEGQTDQKRRRLDTSGDQANSDGK